MSTDVTRKMATATMALVLGMAVMANGGDLNPPPGPVVPTLKPLATVEPRINVNALSGSDIATHVIDGPGSYMLTGNITGETGKHGILIKESTGVTLDLNGFTLRGVPGSLNGIHLEAGGQTPRGLTPLQVDTITNGIIAEFEGSGIFAEDAPNRKSVVNLIKLNVLLNGVDGIKAIRAVIANVIAGGNGRDGLNTNQAEVDASFFSDNGRNGVTVTLEAILKEVSANGNVGHGASLSGRSSLEEFLAIGNEGNGLTASGELDVTGFDLSGNAIGADVANAFNASLSGGMASGNHVAEPARVGAGAVVKGGTFAGNGFGVLVANAGAFIRDCVFNLNGVGVHVQESGDGTSLIDLYFYLNTVGAELTAGTTKVQLLKCVFDMNTTGLKDLGTDNKIAAFNCPPEGAWDNTELRLP